MPVCYTVIPTPEAIELIFGKPDMKTTAELLMCLFTRACNFVHNIPEGPDYKFNIENQSVSLAPTSRLKGLPEGLPEKYQQNII